MSQRSIDTELPTPFGTFNVKLWKHKDYAVVISGAATVNRVDYSIRVEFHSQDGHDWNPSDLSMNRLDRKDAPWNFNTREFCNAVLDAWTLALSPLWLTQATENKRQHDIETLTEEIATLAQTLQEKRAALAVLQTPEEKRPLS